MKSQTAAEAVAAAHLARSGAKFAGTLKVISVADEETGGVLGAKWITENRPDLSKVDFLVNEGAGAVMPYGDRRLYGVCVAEKGTFRFNVTTSGTAAHASVPGLVTNALLELAPLITRLGEGRPGYDLIEATHALVRALGEDPDDPAGAVERVAAIEPRLAPQLDAAMRVTFAPTIASAGEKINVIPARAQVRVDCRVPPGMGTEVALKRAREVLGDDGYELDFTEAVTGNRSPGRVAPDGRHRRLAGRARPGCRGRPDRHARLHRQPLVPRRVPGLRGLRLLPPAPPADLRDLAADARQGRAHRRARPRLRHLLLPRPPRKAPHLMPVPEDKLRLGGMALRNGLLVHGPTHWAAAVRTKDGQIKVGSGPKPRFKAADDVPGLRGLVRLGEAFAVLPLVKKGLPEAKMAFENPSVLGVAAGTSVAGALLRRRAPGVSGELASSLIALAPALFALRGGELAAYHGVEHKAIAAYEQDDADARDALKEHDRCGSHLMAPMLAANLAGTLLLKRAVAKPSPLAGGAVALASTAAAVEVFAWTERHADSSLTRVLKRPGFELQRLIGTREPDERQLEVGRAALDEILRVED